MVVKLLAYRTGICMSPQRARELEKTALRKIAARMPGLVFNCAKGKA